MVSVNLYQEEYDLISQIRLYRSGYPNNNHLHLEVLSLVDEMLEPDWLPEEIKKELEED